MTHLRLSAAAVAAALLLIYLFAGWTSLDAGQVGVLLKQFGSDRGMQKDTLGPGTHWVEPFAYDVYVYDTRFVQKEQAHESAIPAGTQDGQPIEIDISFQVGLDAAGVPSLHQNVGRGWWDQVVLPLVRSTVRNEAAKVRSEDVYTGVGRETIQKGVSSILQEKLAPLGIVLQETNLRDIRFDNKQFIDALNMKAISEQQMEINKRNAAAAVEEANRVKNVAEGARYQVEQQAQAEREKRRLEGEGERLQKEEQAKGILAIAQAEAEGTRLRNAALTGPGGERIVQMEWARNLGPKLSVYGVPVTDKSSFIFSEALKGAIPVAVGSN